MSRVELYGATNCPYTVELRDELLWNGTEFVEHTVDEDRTAFERLVELTGATSVPVLVEDGEVTRVGWQGRTCMASPPSE